jgi:predicted DNA binding CopG/RHH family protein
MVKKLPVFQSEKEELEFWEIHSAADYWDALEDVEQVELSPRLRNGINNRSRLKMVSLRLREDQITAAKAIAKEKDIPYQVLLRSWITEKIKSEKRKQPSPTR